MLPPVRDFAKTKRGEGEVTEYLEPFFQKVIQNKNLEGDETTMNTEKCETGWLDLQNAIAINHHGSLISEGLGSSPGVGPRPF